MEVIKPEAAKVAAKAARQDETYLTKSELRAVQRMSSAATPGSKPGSRYQQTQQKSSICSEPI